MSAQMKGKFLTKGYHVDTVDGSEELVKIARRLTGVNVKHMYFQELAEKDKYDGIWDLHLNKKELKDVLKKMAAALNIIRERGKRLG